MRERVECTKSPIVGSSSRAEYVAIASSQQRAVFQLQILDGEGLLLGLCSATLVAPYVALTAAHCVEDGAGQLVARFGEDVSVVEEVVSRAQVIRHPTLDLVLLQITNDLATQGAQPISIAIEEPIEENSPVQIAGFGVTEQDTVGTLRYAVSLVREVDEASFRVGMDGRTAACDGDSGGPALIRASDGRLALAGVLSNGAESCGGLDEYTRVDGIREWLSANGSLVERGPVLADCALIQARGQCFGQVALWCDDEAVRAERCESGAVCGFSRGSDGFRCVPTDADPCRGETSRGRCDGNQLIRCELGVVETLPCASCNASCDISVRSGDAVCNARSTE